MFHWPGRKRSPQQRQDVPADIYVSIVDSLFGDSRSLFMGAITVAVAMLLSAWKTQEPLLYVVTAGMILVNGARAILIAAYYRQRERVTTIEAAGRWETAYAIGVSAHVAIMGVWCVVAFGATDDTFAQFVSVVGTIANLIGIAGRNFGSTRLVLVQILFGAPLVTLALVMPGDIYYGMTGVLLLCFFASLKFISDRLRKTLIDAVITTRDITFLANRFDAALNNMPLGLWMFDAERRLIVSNRRCTEILGVQPGAFRNGATVHELVQQIARTGIFAAESAKRIAADLESRLSGADSAVLEFDTEDGRTLALTFQPVKTGGSIVLLEDVTERKAAAAKINRLARYDAVTGLPNRAFFRDQMEHSLAGIAKRKHACAVLFIDLDQFKQVNDTMGHPFGDSLLCAVADRLRGIVRDTDIVARFGGDEFVILQYPVKHPTEAATLAQQVVEVIGRSFEIEGNQVLIGASVGIAVAPQDGIDADLLLKNADMALYRAKSEGRGAWRFFEREMDVQAQARRSLELDLRTALVEDTFKLYYQPLINLKTRRISTCEALLRWPHPERGMVSPAEFIPVAEEMGLIVPIGRRVLRMACIECTKWPQDVRVAINLSPTQFRRGNVIAAVREALDESGLAANRLEIEITESVLVQDTEATRAALVQLREMGVRISLDDFGTGYSSLSYLHSFPLHKVKIDRSFLKDIAGNKRSLTLLRGVARLSSELGLAVVVEGVETDEELELVTREAAIDEAQGYLFSPAIPGPAIRDLLLSSSARKIRVVA
jgi:diguanylate cyclase (GGDEF)-like protein